MTGSNTGRKATKTNKYSAFMLDHRIVVFISILLLLVLLSVALFAYQRNSTVRSQTSEQSVQANKAPVNNADLLQQMGITEQAISDSPSVGVAKGRCKSDKIYVFNQNGTLSVTSVQKGGVYVCTTYNVNTVKTYVNTDGATVTEETHANTETGAVQTIKTTTNNGNNQVSAGYQAPDGSGMGWGGSGTEQCFGPTNTVCTMVDTGAGPTFVTMLQTCILVSTNDSYWRLGTAADNLAAKTLADGSSCANWQNYKNLFYNK